MKKGLIALVLSAFISNAYAVEINADELNGEYQRYNSAGEHIAGNYYCYKDIGSAISYVWNNAFYKIVPSDGSLREFSLRNRLKEVERFEYIKKSESLASAIKNDFETWQKKLYMFRDNLMKDGCTIIDKCKFKDHDLVSCEMKKPLDEILNNLDKYYTDIK
ncbi:hypothetical protein [Helicobacter bilis]|uniref:hypothetical protein n=1 Tax=Helicobacter bilis TaxID=37372 RepID=UPI000CF1B732|nr:hypothetical protein [Helicobacter bilis]